MTLTIEIPEFDRLLAKARELYWHWAETDPWVKDKWSVRLGDILRGLRHGRLKVAETDTSWCNIAVPPQGAPEKLPPVFLIGLTVLATEVEIWERADPWLSGSGAAQAVAARLQREMPEVSGKEFVAHFGEIAYFAAGGRMLSRWDRVFGDTH